MNTRPHRTARYTMTAALGLAVLLLGGCAAPGDSSRAPRATLPAAPLTPSGQTPTATPAAPPAAVPAATPAPEGQTAAPAADDPAHSSRTSLDWAGTYAGTLPCADCEGIRTTLVLHASGRFKETRQYLHRQETRFTRQGHFTWDRTGSVITLSAERGAARVRYRVAEGQLLRLQPDGTPLDGPMASHYTLTLSPKPQSK